VVGVGFVVGVGVVSLVLSLLLALLLVGSKGRSRRAHGVHARRLAYMCIRGSGEGWASALELRPMNRSF
jgi:hypothetical protein